MKKPAGKTKMRYAFFKVRILFILIVIVVSGISGHAQTDYTWWAKIHNWDGYSPWNNYLTFSAQYFGPNALPVPEISKGSAGFKGYAEIAADAHLGDGDFTQNLFTKIYYPILAQVAAVEAYVVPIEHFKMDTITRDIRAARLRSGEGTAGGDIYFGTIIQFVKNKRFPDVAFRASMRTASGTNVSAARYTDAPGYFFDLSAGKEYIHRHNYFDKWRPYLMLGFYSWQTNSPVHRQDDAFLYGAGLDLTSEKIIISASAGGYYGYLKNHDTPAVFRLGVSTNRNRFNYGIYAQAGITDYPYNSIRLSAKYMLPSKLMLKK